MMPPEVRLPFPVIVGAPRSGTTLLRLMLDSHPELAIPPETGFIPGCNGLFGGVDELKEQFVRYVTHFPTNEPAWADFGIPVATLQRELEKLDEFTPSAGLRAFYRLYANRFGKPRWGDKTPSHGREMPAIERLLPEAHFIHLIRDGRDVALSWRETWFSPGEDMTTLARAWRDWIEAIRNGAARVAYYLEVRFERLVTEPEAVLREVAAFVELPYDAEMLNFHARSRHRLREHVSRYGRDGQLVVSRRGRVGAQRLVMRPIDVSRVGAWQSVLTIAQRQEFAAEAGPLLSTLGYEP